MTASRSGPASLGTSHTSELFGLVTYDIGDGRVVSLAGELDACSCAELAEHLTGPPGILIVVDLLGLTFIDSSGLGAIHRARQAAIDGGGSLVVCRPSPMVERVLEITGLDTWIEDWNPAWSSRFAPESALEGQTVDVRSTGHV